MFRVPPGELSPVISVPGAAARRAVRTMTSSTMSEVLGLTVRIFM